MKNFISRVSLVAGLAFWGGFSPEGYAGHSVGNGGNGIEIGGQLHLLDLVEAGVEDQPFFESAVRAEKQFEDVAQLLFWEFPDVAKGVAQKLSELAKQDRWTAAVLSRAMRMYSWRWVSMNLVTIDDYDGSDLSGVDPKSLYQLAVRDGQTIRIDQALWKRLNVGHQVALVFHEVVYAFFPKDSRRARDIVGALFSTDIQRGPLFLDGVFNPIGAAQKVFMFRNTVVAASPGELGQIGVLESVEGTLLPISVWQFRSVKGLRLDLPRHLTSAILPVLDLEAYCNRLAPDDLVLLDLPTSDAHTVRFFQTEDQNTGLLLQNCRVGQTGCLGGGILTPTGTYVRPGGSCSAQLKDLLLKALQVIR